MSKEYKKLSLCLFLDIVGYVSFLVPWSDFFWAPLSAYIMVKLFKSRQGKYAALVSFIEEILPFTDIIPTFTIMYYYEKYQQKKAQRN